MTKLKNHLLFIGIDKYKYENPLKSCLKDCNDIRDILLEKYDFQPQNVIEVFDEKATNKGIQDVFRKLILDLTEFDNLIIYYSGHGSFNKEYEKGYWVPCDAEKGNYTDWIENETILEYIDKMQCKHILLISDSCFSWSLLSAGKAKKVFEKGQDYDYYNSRWGLAAGVSLTFDGINNNNSKFAEAIINVLISNKEDLRVSKFVENIKDRFNNYDSQKPQGSPFSICKKHDNGEFIFRIFDLDSDDNNIPLKGFKDFYTLLKFFRRNSEFIYIDKYEEKPKKIGYEIYKEKDDVSFSNCYFIYLYRNLNQKQTFEHISAKYPELSKSDKIIIIPREKSNIRPEKRLQNIKDKFSPLNVFYIDDFIRDHCTPKSFNNQNEEDYLDITNFVIPSIDNNEKDSNVNQFIDKWLGSENEPISVIKGEGGIGKTTFARYIADKFKTNNPQNFVLFIDSREIYENLMRIGKLFKTISIYNFYEALHEISKADSEKMHEYLFKTNLDAGNFLLIIDGLDEIISNVVNFDVNRFIDNILNYNSNQGFGKVIITCRSYFWDTTKYKSIDIHTIEILPFSGKQTREFFQKSFNDDKVKIRKASELAESFIYNDNKYPPYVLDVIKRIVESNSELLKYDTTFTSLYLQQEIKTDYILYKICDRETYRINQIGIDNQIKFFSHLAIKMRGITNIENLENVIIASLGKKIKESEINAFKSHPLIKVLSKTLQFKYDFLPDYFKSIYVSLFIKYGNDYTQIDDYFLKIIKENCWFGSSMLTDIAVRIHTWEDDDLLKCSELIEQIFNSDKEIEDKKLCVANLVNICFAINKKLFSNDIDKNTYLMRALFEKNNQINGLCIKDIRDVSIRFDFSDMIFKNCYFDNHNAFWVCRFNKNTYFYDSEFYNINYDKTDKLPIVENQFINCNFDKNSAFAFRKDVLNTEDLHLRIKKYLVSLFRIFLSNGKLEGITYDKHSPNRQTFISAKIAYSHLLDRVFKFDNIFKILIDEKIVEKYAMLGESKIKISKTYKTDIYKFIQEGTISKVVLNLIDILIKEYSRKN